MNWIICAAAMLIGSDQYYHLISISGDYFLISSGEDYYILDDRHTGRLLNDCSQQSEELIYCINDGSGFEFSLPKHPEYIMEPGFTWSTHKRTNKILFSWAAMLGERYFAVESVSEGGSVSQFLVSHNCGLVSYKNRNGVSYSINRCGLFQDWIARD